MKRNLQSYNKCRERRGDCASVMEDAFSKKLLFSNSLIQETGQEQRLARMVGLSSLDSAQSSMEAGCRIALDFFGRGGKDD